MAKNCPPGCGCGKHVHVVRTFYDKQCLECGGPFVAKRVDARFCSGGCHREWYERENKDRLRAKRAQWAREHRGEVREIQRQYDQRHRGERLLQYAEVGADPERAAARQAAHREYYKANRERILARAKERRSQELSAKKSYQAGADWDALFNAFWVAQDGKCYLCGTDLERDVPQAVHLDHDHSCCPLARSCERCRRGLACQACNYIIGRAKDDPARLRRMADSLEKALEGVRLRMKQPRQPRLGEIKHDLTCEACSEPFQSRMSNTRCCSSKCYERLRYQERLKGQDGRYARTCPVCGREFMARTPRGTYCTKLCAHKVYEARKAAKEVPVGQQDLPFSA